MGRTLVERRRVRAVDPRVLHGDGRRAVQRRRREVAALEERLVEAHVEQRVQARVDVDAAMGGRGVSGYRGGKRKRREERKESYGIGGIQADAGSV